MARVGPLKFKRTPEPVRRKLEVAAAAAWEDVVDSHADHAARFVALTAYRLPFDDAIDRFISEMDLRDPIAAAVRARVLSRLEQAPPPTEGGPEIDASDRDPGVGGLKRFRPDVLARGIARKVRETEAFDEWVRLAIARAEEGALQAHIHNAVEFTAILGGHLALDEAVEDYIDLMRISGGRAQSVFQRSMARLADIHLPPDSATTADSDTATVQPG
jgi:hypothetical protein